MCESISTDLDDAEFVQTQVTTTGDKKMDQHSNAGDLVESSSDPGEVQDPVNTRQPAEEDFDDIASDWEDSISSLLGNYDPVLDEVEEPIDDQLECSTSTGLENSSSVPDGVLEQVADRLRIIGDEMDSDIRQNRMLGRRRAAGLPVRGFDVIVDLFPLQSTSRKSLDVVGDLDCETLARDLVHVTVRRALVAAGSVFAHALFCELISNTVASPVDFRLRWSTIKWTRWPVG